MSLRNGGLVAVSVLLTILLLTGTAAAQDEVTISGPASPFGVVEEGDEGQLGELVDKLEAAGYDVPPNVYFVLGDEQREQARYIVFANTSGHPGILNVTGENATHVFGENAGTDRIIISERSSLQRDGEPATREQVNANIDEYKGELVEIETNYTQFTHQVGLSNSIHFQQVAFGEVDGATIIPTATTPSNASVTVMSTSMEEWEGEIYRTVSEGEELEPLSQGGGPNWFSTGPSKIDVIVFGKDEFLVAKHRPVVHSEVSVDEISSGTVEEGDRVAVTTDISGSAISVKQAMLKVAKCAPESVLAPVVQCLPLTTDVTVHTGLMEGESSVVAYAGVSNYRVDGLADVEQGEYLLMGEIVAADDLDADMPGQYALRVEYMEQKSAGGISSDLQSAGDVLEQRFINEIGSVAGEHGTYSERVDRDNLSDNEFDTENPNLEPTNTDVIRFQSISYNPQYAENGDVTRALITVENTGEQRAVERVTISLAGMTKYDRLVALNPGEQQQFTVDMSVENNRLSVYIDGERVGQIGHPPDGWTPSPTPTISYDVTDENTSSEDGGAVSPAISVFCLIMVLMGYRRFYDDSYRIDF